MSVTEDNQALEILRCCLQRAMPFVAYRKPDTNAIRLLVADKLESFLFQSQDMFSDEAFLVVPFEDEHSFSYLLSPRFDVELSSISPEQYESIQSIPLQNLHLKEHPDKDSKQGYLDSFSQIYSQIKKKSISKAILSRCHFEADVKAMDAPVHFLELCKSQHNTFNYLLFIPDAGLWMGASPELFLHKGERAVETVSLAGTKKHENAPVWDDKELKEQDIVTEYISEQLEQFKIEEIEKEGPHTVSAGHVSHLKTLFRFPIKSLENHMGAFVQSLHPTPAVCGYPKEQSKQLILQTEKHQRGLYAGFLGRIEKNGQFSFYVNIRCMQYFKNGAGLYVGGGITAQSEAESEYQETILKANNLKKILK